MLTRHTRSHTVHAHSRSHLATDMIACAHTGTCIYTLADSHAPSRLCTLTNTRPLLHTAPSPTQGQVLGLREPIEGAPNPVVGLSLLPGPLPHSGSCVWSSVNSVASLPQAPRAPCWPGDPGRSLQPCEPPPRPGPQAFWGARFPTGLGSLPPHPPKAINDSPKSSRCVRPVWA